MEYNEVHICEGIMPKLQRLQKYGVNATDDVGLLVTQKSRGHTP